MLHATPFSQMVGTLPVSRQRKDLLYFSLHRSCSKSAHFTVLLSGYQDSGHSNHRSVYVFNVDLDHYNVPFSVRILKMKYHPFVETKSSIVVFLKYRISHKIFTAISQHIAENLE